MCSYSHSKAHHSNSQHIHCIAHVINLGAQAVLKELDALGESEDAIANTSGSQVKKLQVVKKLRLLIVKIRSSPQKRERFFAQCAVAGLKQVQLIINVPTRWGSTSDMIERAIELREAIDTMAMTDKEMQYIQISESEWYRLSQILELLKIFKNATTRMSGSSYPTLPLAAPLYSFMLSYIREYIDDKSKPENCKEALKAAVKKLDRYIKATDSKAYYIATILDPGMKTDYYKRQGWQDRHIKDATQTVVDEYNQKYASYDQPAVENVQDPRPEGIQDFITYAYGQNTVEQSHASETEKYLNEPVENARDIGVLNWWKQQETRWPNLSRMAKDYLAIPASSVPVENIFSTGRDLISIKRGTLSHDMITACMCLKNWWKSHDNTGLTIEY